MQVHTPRDNRWKGARPADDAGRSDYAARFVEACRAKGLGAVAITDHHDFAFFRFIREAAKTETDAAGEPIPDDDRLVVFPGLELTLGVPCQALLIFDADLPVDRLLDVLAALSIEPVDVSDDRLPPVVPLDHFKELADVHTQLDLREGLRGRYILLPNVTDGGHQTIMRKGMHAKYRDMPCVGGYLDGTVDKVGTGNAAIFAGGDKSRGNKPLALYQTSDARSEDFKKLGDPSTWVKWSEPTAEALRQACLARESRISHAEPSLPTAWITRLSVGNSKFMGPIELRLNPQYNAVVGGRGTGKSSILGYVRWALCDHQLTSHAKDDVSGAAARDLRLVEATLGPYSSTVDVHLSVNGIAHVVRRSAADGSVQLKIGDAEFRAAEASEVRRLLPIQAYSQKQLSTVAVRIDELTRFVTAPIRRELQEIDARARELDGQVREAYTVLQRSRALDESISALSLELSSTQDQAASLRDGMSGVSKSDRALLDSKSEVDRARSMLDDWAEAAASTSKDVATTIDEVENARVSLELPGEPWGEIRSDLTELHSMRDAAYERLLADLQVAQERFDAAMSSVANDDRTERVANQVSEFDEEYEEVKRRSTTHEAKLAELGELEKQQESLSRKLRREQSARDDLGDAADLLERRRNELVELMIARSEAVDAQCSSLSELSDGMIRATLERGQGLQRVADAFRGFISGSGVRSAKVDSLFEQLADDADPLSTWNKVLSELEMIASASPERELRSEDAPTTSRLGMTVSELNKIAAKATSDGWLGLALTPVEDHPRFEYRTREDDYIAFEDASAGQQATALMAVLLAQPGPPLVVDQPEDDLDSQVVQDVVSRLWNAKSKRQIIFASHNANLVVNGDADLVVCCDYRVAGDQSGGRIKLEGAIDQSAVRSEITTVMEGGERAFRLRKEKYGF